MYRSLVKKKHSADPVVQEGGHGEFSIESVTVLSMDLEALGLTQ